MIAEFKTLLSSDTFLLYLGLFSLLFFVVTLILIPWLILQIPEDYFEESHRHPFLKDFNHPLLRTLLLFLKNLLGFVLVLVGIALLVLPGQGLLTILLGIILLDFPGKFRLERWFVQQKTVLRSINWLRKKGRRAPIRI